MQIPGRRPASPHPMPELQSRGYNDLSILTLNFCFSPYFLSICLISGKENRWKRHKPPCISVSRIKPVEGLSLRRNWVTHPLPRTGVCFPPWIQRGREQHTPFRVRGWGHPIPTTGQKAWHSVYSVSVINPFFVSRSVTFIKGVLLSNKSVRRC
jgi:hypothetical protein